MGIAARRVIIRPRGVGVSVKGNIRSMRATASFQITKSEEMAYSEREGVTLKRSSMVKFYKGDLQGEGRLEYLVCVREDGSANYVGMANIEGRIGDRSGSFLLHYSGVYE